MVGDGVIGRLSCIVKSTNFWRDGVNSYFLVIPYLSVCLSLCLSVCSVFPSSDHVIVTNFGRVREKSYFV